jgi:hypothetical protein
MSRLAVPAGTCKYEAAPWFTPTSQDAPDLVCDLYVKEEPIVILPKPVVLVHGFRGGAQDAWGDFAPLLAKPHPGHGTASADSTPLPVHSPG